MKIHENEVCIPIKVVMNKRWMPYFISFLKRMEADGKVGHSEMIGFYADGDGDFRPRFIFEDGVDDPENKKPAEFGYYVPEMNGIRMKDFSYFDAG